MVGLRRTNACGTCRKRRVTCDEVRPVCGQCSIKGRECTESQPPGVTWARNGQLSVHHATAKPSDTNTSCSTSGNKEMCLAHVITVPGGGVMHKYRLGLNDRNSKRLPKALAMAPIERLRCQFLDAYLRGPPGLRLSGYSPLLGDLPRYLGHSKALDDSLSCLIWTYDLRSQGKVASGNAAYMVAIRSLQQTLNKPADASRGTALCAITLLTWTEVLGEERMDEAYVQHVGGLSTLIQLLGPSCVNDSLARDVTIGAAGSFIMDSIMKNQPCFITEPEWSWILSDDPSRDERRRLFIRILKHFSSVASILVRVRQAIKRDDRPTLRLLFDEATHLRTILHAAKDEVDYILSVEGLETRQLKQSFGQAPITDTLWFKDPSTSRAANMCWALLIYINNILICLIHILDETDTNDTTSGVAEDELRTESTCLGRQIFMSTAYVAQLAPIGSTYMRLPIYIAWATLLAEHKDWVVWELHKLNAGLIVEYHTVAVLDWTSRFLCGWDLVPSLS